jgi:transcriptional regulator with XRE-family HTH domain
VLTSAQIRCARAALGWSAQELADKSGVVRRTIASIEGQAGVPSANSGTLLKIQATLEAAGIEFIGRPDDAPGIRMHTRS